MSEVIVSVDDIVKYYSADEQRRFEEYVSSDKHKPRSVKGVHFLRERSLLPLVTGSPKLGLMAYVAGLNWYAGSIHIGKTSACCPQFYVGKYDRCASLPGVASALHVPLAPDPKLNPNPKYDRYTMPSAMALLLSELGIPSNGSKADFAEPYPDIVDTLLLHDHERTALFLGAQLLTQASRHSGDILVSTIEKSTEELAQRTGNETYHLYREVFPSIEIGKPKLHAAHGKFYATIRMSESKYDALVERTHKLLREESYRSSELVSS